MARRSTSAIIYVCPYESACQSINIRMCNGSVVRLLSWLTNFLAFGLLRLQLSFPQRKYFVSRLAFSGPT